MIQISPSSSSRSQTEADIRVLQRNTAAPNSVYVAGDYPVTDPSDVSAYVFIPSVVRDKAGNLQGIFGVSGTGVSEHPGLESLFFNPGTLSSSTYGYIASPATSGDAQDTDTLNYRWGDWFSAALDPSDSCTVWVAGQYLQSTRTTEPFWYTEMASLPAASTCSTGPVLLSNVSLNFGTNAIGVQTAPLVETIKNNQSANLNISAVSIASGDFTQTNNCVGQAIAPQGTCTVSVYLTPSASGLRTASLLITDDASNSPQTIALAGTGASSSLSFSPTTLAFGSQPLNTPSTGQSITVTNSGFSDVTISSILASGSYTETDSCGGVLLTPGQTCSITVTFNPAYTGSIPGTVTINDNAAGAPHIVTLSGTGTVTGVVLGESHISCDECGQHQRYPNDDADEQSEPGSESDIQHERRFLGSREWNDTLRCNARSENQVHLWGDLYSDDKRRYQRCSCRVLQRCRNTRCWLPAGNRPERPSISVDIQPNERRVWERRAKYIDLEDGDGQERELGLYYDQ